MTKDESLNGYVDKRISAAKALSIYMIRSALRSSRVALVELIEGTDAGIAKLHSIFSIQLCYKSTDMSSIENNKAPLFEMHRALVILWSEKIQEILDALDAKNK